MQTGYEPFGSAVIYVCVLGVAVEIDDTRTS